MQHTHLARGWSRHFAAAILITVMKPALAGHPADCTEAEITAWERKVVSTSPATLDYPLYTRMEQREGAVTVEFAIDEKGRITSQGITRTSGYLDLDQEAARANGARTFPPLICGDIARATSTEQRFVFKLNDRHERQAPPLSESRKALILSIIQQLPSDEMQTAFADKLPVTIRQFFKQQIPTLGDAMLAAVETELRNKMRQALSNESGMQANLLRCLHSNFTTTELTELNRMLASPGSRALLVKLSTLPKDVLAVGMRWQEKMLQDLMRTAIARVAEEQGESEASMAAKIPRMSLDW
jgi:TonB family protein